MTLGELLTDAFGRVREVVHEVADGLGAEALAHRPDEESNSIAWILWHLTRIQDDHVSKAAGTEQVWITGGWVERFSLPFDKLATGYGQSSQEVGAVKPDAELLTAYYDAVHEETIRYVGSLSAGDLDRVVDDRWDPPVTLGVRLVSVITDDLQHAGQAAFVKGLTLGD